NFSVLGSAKIDGDLLPSLSMGKRGASAVSFDDKVILTGGASGSDDVSYSDSLDVFALTPVGDASGKLLRRHPSYGVGKLHPARGHHTANSVGDLLIAYGGSLSGTTFGSETLATTNILEAYKLTANNVQGALDSASGSDTLSFTLQRLNPTASFPRAPGITGSTGIFLVDFDLENEPDDEPTSVFLQWSTDGGRNWFEASPVEGVGIDLSSVVPGTNLTVSWDSAVQFPGNFLKIKLRFRSGDGAVSPPSEFIDIINIPPDNPVIPTVTDLTRADQTDDSGDIEFNYVLTDDNDDNSSLEVTYFDGTGLQIIEILADIPPGSALTYSWDSSDVEESYLAETYLCILPTDGATGDEGVGDCSETFALFNGSIQIQDEQIFVTNELCNAVPMVDVDGIYTCGNDGTMDASFDLDASGATNGNTPEALVFQWELVEAVSGVSLQNEDTALATVVISDDGTVTQSNNERGINVKLTVSQAQHPEEPEILTKSLQLNKPAVSLAGDILSYQCGDGSVTSVDAAITTLKASCTETTIRVLFDASGSVNPNTGGVNLSWAASSGSVTQPTTATAEVTFTLPAEFTDFEVVLSGTDAPNSVADPQDLTFKLELKQQNDQTPLICNLSAELDEETGLVTTNFNIVDGASCNDESDVGEVLVSLEDQFSRSGVAFSPTAGTISGLSASYQTPVSVQFTWDSSVDITGCETGLQLGLQLTDEEAHVTSAKTSVMDVWNCGDSGSISGTLGLMPTVETGTTDNSNGTTCRYDGGGALQSATESLGIITLYSLAGQALSTGTISCADSSSEFPTYEIPLRIDLRVDAAQDPEILQKSYMEARYNSGQYAAALDLTDHSVSMAAATPTSRAIWELDLDERTSYFYGYVSTITSPDFGTEDIFALLPDAGDLDLDALLAIYQDGFVLGSGTYSVGVGGFVSRTLLIFSDEGLNSSDTTQDMEAVFKDYFARLNSASLTSEEVDTLLESYFPLRDLIDQRKIATDSNLITILDTLINKLLQVGIPGTDGVSNDPNDPNNTCVPGDFTVSISDILDRTIGLSQATTGTVIEFEGQARLDTLTQALSDPGLLEPQNCAQAQETLAQLLADAISISDEFLDAIAQNTQAALDMAALLGQANGVLASAQQNAITTLSGDLADIADLDNYLNKLKSANGTLKAMANKLLDEELLNALLAESLKQSAKSTG
ncbi:hypothetical protein HOF92_15305, partial [bacterium]|nr:hypothetical protein [bacterium]